MPFDILSSTDSIILADFRSKVGRLKKISDEVKKKLIDDAKKAMQEFVKPAYLSLVATLERQAKLARTDDGVWKMPNGAAFYEFALSRTTTLDLSASRIHELGKAEVARIHQEMKQIITKVEFEGSLQDFFAFMRGDKQFYYSNNEEGRKKNLQETKKIIETMEARLSDLFISLPSDKLRVKRVEAYREKSAGKAFYNSPAPDGSRAGIYYVNLFDMANMPSYQMEALAYHEGVPGHHMQFAIAQKLQDLPKFRRFGNFTAYSEGWGLYSEFVPKEMGFYDNPYSDFGRLAMELWRACRLVVDTGIHSKRWTREFSISYLMENTPNPKGDAVKAIERYIIMPSQATAYKIGMLKILELRAKAKQALGDQFDIRGFHEQILTSGPVPLLVLQKIVDEWIQSQIK